MQLQNFKPVLPNVVFDSIADHEGSLLSSPCRFICILRCKTTIRRYVIHRNSKIEKTPADYMKVDIINVDNVSAEDLNITSLKLNHDYQVKRVQIRDKHCISHLWRKLVIY